MMKEIKLYTAPDANFTPAGLMKRYADQHPGVSYRRDRSSEAQLTISGCTYKYDHWKITREGPRDRVTLYLGKVGA